MCGVGPKGEVVLSRVVGECGPRTKGHKSSWAPLNVSLSMVPMTPKHECVV